MKKIILILVATIIATASYSQTTQKKPVNTPKITFDTMSHDFKNIEKGKKVSFEFKFTNTGDQPLVVLDCITSCDCTSADWTKDPVMPNQSGKVVVTYNPKTEGLVNKQITVRSNADDTSVMLSIKGIVVSN